MKNSLKKTLEGLDPGDLIYCDWCDASTGKTSSNGGVIDMPVRSWGIFVGVFGKKIKHIVLAQNSFEYADGLFDLDYTAIPLGWAVDATVLVKAHFPQHVARKLINSFLMKDSKMFVRSNRPRTFFQRRLSIHGGHH
jgi:hypothetical protein